MNRRRIQFITSLLIVILSFITLIRPEWFETGSNLQFAAVQPGFYRVEEVYDGDTIGVDMNGKLERIRLIGVDTPETHHPSLPVQCFGRAAGNFTKTLINNQSVRLEADPQNMNRDRYNRLLRYVYLPDGNLINKTIIIEGYGFAYTYFPFTKSEEFKVAELLAKTQNKGLWGSCQLQEESNGNRKTIPATD